MKSRAFNPLCDSGYRAWFAPFSLSAARLALIGLIVLMLGGCEGSSSEEGIDPGLVEIPIAYIKRPVPVEASGQPRPSDMRDPMLFTEGGDVYLRSSTGVAASEENLTRSFTRGRGESGFFLVQQW